MASMGNCGTRPKKKKRDVGACLTRVVVGSCCAQVGVTREIWWCWWLVHRWCGGPPVGFRPVLLVVRLLLVGFARATNEIRRTFQRCTTPVFGQGSYAVLVGV